MTEPAIFDLFAVATPGLEPQLTQEAEAIGLDQVQGLPGGVGFRGGWSEVWRANLMLRGATRVLVRIAEFRAMHLAQLDKRARRVPWAEFIVPGTPVRVEASSKKSRIYHAGAVKQRVERALSEQGGAEISETAALRILVRLDDDLCTISIDSSGAPLHKRGFKTAVAKAPMRETMASMFLRACGYDGQEPVLDPMCGSGTFVIEAAEWAQGLAPGRARAFAFEQLVGFDAEAWATMRAAVTPTPSPVQFFGSDRNAGAVEMSTANAERAGVADVTRFMQASVEDLERPDGPAGLVIVNPPYGARISNKKLLFGVHARLGARLRERFQGWRVGIVTSDGSLARATDLPFEAPGPFIAHGGLKIRLYQTGRLPG